MRAMYAACPSPRTTAGPPVGSSSTGLPDMYDGSAPYVKPESKASTMSMPSQKPGIARKEWTSHALQCPRCYSVAAR